MVGSLCFMVASILINNALGHPIVHGVLPRDPTQFSFAVSLQQVLRNGTLVHFCGGTYLGQGWILTANHCVVGSDPTSGIYAYVGGLPLLDSQPIVRRSVRQVFSHPDYNRVTLGSDIALLRIDGADGSLQLLDKLVQSNLLLPPKGDSGGGLVCRRKIWGPVGDGKRPYTLRGIISYGAGCGAPASPGVYTDVGFYRTWIDKLIAASELASPNA